jgi:polyhydroxybutyrate depolymerase
LNPNVGAPLLLVHHGFLMDGEAMRTLTGYQAIADREGFVVAFPTGIGNTWNVGTGACGGGALVSGTSDDLAFVKTMISSIEADQCLSREHVFMTGFSMGAYFSNHAGCQMSDVVHGVAPHSGGTYPGSCPGGPVPVMLWQGTADTTVDPNCSRTARDTWVVRNGCQATVDTVQVTNGTCEWSKGCPPGGQVVLCMMNGMNHQWAGGTGLIGAPTYENASEMIWTFFKKQSGL